MKNIITPLTALITAQAESIAAQNISIETLAARVAAIEGAQA